MVDNKDQGQGKAQVSEAPKSKNADSVEAGNARAVENRGRFGVDSPHDLGASDDLLRAAQLRAPSLTAAFVDEHALSDDYLQDIADGLEPPPPTVGPANKLYRTPGGWVNVAAGTTPDDSNVGKGGYGPNVGTDV